jgi:hypothetical protein
VSEKNLTGNPYCLNLWEQIILLGFNKNKRAMKTGLLNFITGLSLAILVLTSCRSQFSIELTEEEKKAVSKEIETIVRNFMNASTLNYETHTGLRANKEGYVMGGDGIIKFTSFDDYYKNTKAGFSGIQKFTESEIIALHVYVLSPESASCTTQFKSKFLTTAGDTVVNNGCWTFVFKKFDNEWKVIQENGTHTR